MFDDNEINTLVSKAVTQDVLWQIENNRDCFTGVKDDSMYTLSNWQVSTRGSVQPSSTYFWTQGDYQMPTLMLNGLNSIVADSSCELDLD